MAKPWILSGLVVGCIVAVVLVLMKDPSVADDDVEKRSELPPPPPALHEKQVVTYIEIWRQLDPILKRAVTAAAKAREADQPVPPEANARPHVEALLKQYKMTLQDWEKLSEDVEFVVGVLRFERGKPERDRDLANKIVEKEKLLVGATGKVKKAIETDLARLREQQRAVPKPITKASRDLARKYWKSLDAIVPGQGR